MLPLFEILSSEQTSDSTSHFFISFECYQGVPPGSLFQENPDLYHFIEKTLLEAGFHGNGYVIQVRSYGRYSFSISFIVVNKKNSMIPLGKGCHDARFPNCRFHDVLI